MIVQEEDGVRVEHVELEFIGGLFRARDVADRGAAGGYLPIGQADHCEDVAAQPYSVAERQPGAHIGHQLVSPPANGPARDNALWPAWPIKLVSDHVEAKLGSAVHRLQGLISQAPVCIYALEPSHPHTPPPAHAAR